MTGVQTCALPISLQPPPHAQQKLGAASRLRPSAAPTSCTAKAGRCFAAPPLRSPHLMHSKTLALLRGSAPPQPPPHAQQTLGAASRLRPSAAPTSCTAKARSEEHTSELQSHVRISYAVFCLKKKKLHKHAQILPTL